MRIWVEQLSGETLALEVTAEMTMREVKRQIKALHMWEDQVSFDTTVVELMIGEKKVLNDETVAELGLSEGSNVSAVLKRNLAVCSEKSGLGPDLDPEALVIVEFPDSETAIGEQAFYKCTCIARVTIPSSVTRIEGLAFNGCSSLTEVMIPDSVTEILFGAFAGCSSLTSIVIPDCVTQIPFGAFARCASLASVTVPNSLAIIADDAFFECSQLTLTAPARLLDPEVGKGCKAMVAKECGCGDCHWSWFKDGGICPVYDEGGAALKRRPLPRPFPRKPVGR